MQNTINIDLTDEWPASMIGAERKVRGRIFSSARADHREIQRPINFISDPARQGSFVGPAVFRKTSLHASTCNWI